MNRRTFLFAAASALVASGQRTSAQPTTRQSEFLTELPDYPGNVLLARPTDRSITANLFCSRDAMARIMVREQGQPTGRALAPVALTAGEPVEVVVDRLRPNMGYEYDVTDAHTNKPLLTGGTFRTARPPGAAFTFTLQADSHLDEGCRTDIYEQTLANQLSDSPDFMIDLGDTSMAGKHASRESAMKQYLAQRYYFGLIGTSAPSFLVVGNHDGEETKRVGAAEADGLAVWANRQRKRLFTNPVPDEFYGGNSTPHEHAGLLQNYYSWNWGDALFVVLDPYWSSSVTRGNEGGWAMSLGRAQYDWLAGTLRASKAKQKLVFIHQLVGGLDKSGRGGSEAAGLFEWGGSELDGRNTFATRRQGWAQPIHPLLVETGVKAVFHGHDHFFADQEKDGLRYILAPQAAHRSFRRDHAAEYGYQKGRFVPNSGHLRVHVQADRVKVDYVRSVPKSMAGMGVTNGEVAATAVI